MRVVPEWISGYQRKWLPTDVIAGLTVAAILVPEGMAYAQVAGVAAEVAFYTIPPALVLYALFGSSRQLVVATSGAAMGRIGVKLSKLADPIESSF